MEIARRTGTLYKINEAPGEITLRSERYPGDEVELYRNEVESAEYQL